MTSHPSSSSSSEQDVLLKHADRPAWTQTPGYSLGSASASAASASASPLQARSLPIPAGVSGSAVHPQAAVTYPSTHHHVQGHDAEHVEGAHMGHADLNGAVAATSTGTGADTAYTGDDHHDDDEDGVSDADDGEASSADSEHSEEEDNDDEDDEDEDGSDEDEDGDDDDDDDENGDDNAADVAEVPHGEAHHDVAADAAGDANAGGDARRRYMLRMMGNVNPDLHADEPGNPAVVGADGARVQHDHNADPDHPEHDLPREERIKPKPFMHHMRARWRELDGPTRGDRSYDCLTEMCCDKRLCSLRAAQIMMSRAD